MAASAPLRYKLELDFVFAFNEALLSVDGLEKNIPYKIRNRRPFNKNPKLIPSRAYNSWGIDTKQGTYYRPYRNEPIRIARDVLEGEGVPMNPDKLSNGSGKKKNFRFTPWHISAQPIVPGVGSAGLVARLPSLVTQQNMETWDSYGLKASSRIFADSDREEAEEELALLTASLRGHRQDGSIVPNHGAFVTNLTGLAVHIQAPESLDVLKELAFMLVIYEDEINRIHPPFRRIGHLSSKGTLRSNRHEILRRVKVILAKENEEVDLGATDLLSAYVDAMTIRSGIFRCESQYDLLNLLGSEGNELVSWQDPKDQENTPLAIVFRQHHGSLTPLEINAWVAFTTNLIRIAERYAATGGSPIKAWEDHISVFTLMDGLTDSHIEYFRRKIAFYMKYPEDGPDNATDVEMPPEDEETDDDSDNDSDSDSDSEGEGEGEGEGESDSESERSSETGSESGSENGSERESESESEGESESESESEVLTHADKIELIYNGSVIPGVETHVHQKTGTPTKRALIGQPPENQHVSKKQKESHNETQLAIKNGVQFLSPSEETESNMFTSINQPSFTPINKPLASTDKKVSFVTATSVDIPTDRHKSKAGKPVLSARTSTPVTRDQNEAILGSRPWSGQRPDNNQLGRQKRNNAKKAPIMKPYLSRGRDVSRNGSLSSGSPPKPSQFDGKKEEDSNNTPHKVAPLRRIKLTREKVSSTKSSTLAKSTKLRLNDQSIKVRNAEWWH